MPTLCWSMAITSGRTSLLLPHGYGIDRRYVMYNDFIIVAGPNTDPAGIRGFNNARESSLL